MEKSKEFIRGQTISLLNSPLKLKSSESEVISLPQNNLPENRKSLKNDRSIFNFNMSPQKSSSPIILPNINQNVQKVNLNNQIVINICKSKKKF